MSNGTSAAICQGLLEMISEAAELREKVGPGGIFGRDSSAGTIVPGDEVGGDHAFAVELFFPVGTIILLAGYYQELVWNRYRPGHNGGTWHR